MKLNDTMVFNILSALCPNWDITRSDLSLSELAKRNIYYNREKTGCYVELPDQLVSIECNFENDLLLFDTNWDARGAGTYSLKGILPELAKKSKPKSKPKPKEHKNQVDELINRFGRY